MYVVGSWGRYEMGSAGKERKEKHPPRMTMGEGELLPPRMIDPSSLFYFILFYFFYPAIPPPPPPPHE